MSEQLYVVAPWSRLPEYKAAGALAGASVDMTMRYECETGAEACTCPDLPAIIDGTRRTLHVGDAVLRITGHQDALVAMDMTLSAGQQPAA
jgi:hypothetical protein